MTRSNLLARSVNDLGLAAWFGGALMGATAVNRAPRDIDEVAVRAQVVDGVWRRWRPVDAAAVAATAIGGALLTVGNRERVVAQRGVASLSVVKTAVTLAAVAASAWSGWSGRRIAGHVPIADGTTPTDGTPPDVAAALRQERVLQWVVPALTGALIVMNAAQGEQQRPGHVARGVLRRLAPTS
jgi:hypothetical protein